MHPMGDCVNTDRPTDEAEGGSADPRSLGNALDALVLVHLDLRNLLGDVEGIPPAMTTKLQQIDDELQAVMGAIKILVQEKLDAMQSP